MVEKTEGCKIALKTINGKINNENYKYNNDNKPIIEKAKDFFIKGFQLDLIYVPNCQNMKDKFIKYRTYNKNLSLNEHGPIIIINEEKILDDVDEIMENLKDDAYFRSLGIDRVFLKLLQIYPAYCRQKAKKDFIKWISNGDSKEYIQDMFSFQGNMMEIDSKINDIVTKIVKNN